MEEKEIGRFMKLKEGMLISEIDGETILIDPTNKSFSGVIQGNEIFTFLIHQLEKDTTEEELVTALLESYAVNKEMAQKDVKRFIDSLLKYDILQK